MIFERPDLSEFIKGLSISIADISSVSHFVLQSQPVVATDTVS